MEEVKIYETDYERLQEVVTRMNELNDEIGSCLTAIEEKFAEADTLWSGTVHDGFVRGCESDLEAARSSVSDIGTCCNDLSAVCVNQAGTEEELQELVNQLES